MQFIIVLWAVFTTTCASVHGNHTNDSNSTLSYSNTASARFLNSTSSLQPTSGNSSQKSWVSHMSLPIISQLSIIATSALTEGSQSTATPLVINTSSLKISQHTRSGVDSSNTPSASTLAILSQGPSTNLPNPRPSAQTGAPSQSNSIPTALVPTSPKATLPVSTSRTSPVPATVQSSVTNAFDPTFAPQTSIVFNGSTVIYTRTTFSDLATIIAPTTVTTPILNTEHGDSQSTTAAGIIIVGPGGTW